MIKKLKEEKERKKDMVVRNLQKANVIQKKQSEAKKNTIEPIPKKKPNADLPDSGLIEDDDDFFGEAEEIKGDQGVLMEEGGEKLGEEGMIAAEAEEEFNALMNNSQPGGVR